MLIAIHQLHYLPWLRYMHKLASADVFIVLDNIQFNKNGFQNRNSIKTPQGRLVLTVPVLHQFAQNLDQVLIDGKQAWQRKHWGSIQNSYRKAPFFCEHEPFLSEVYAKRKWEKLNDLNRFMLDYFLKALGVSVPVLYGSELTVPGDASERLVNLCKAASGTAYLTGAFAAGQYLQPELFERAGISLAVQEFKAPEYPQLFPEKGFIPELSILDLLLNCGSHSLDILMGTLGGDCPRSRQGLSPQEQKK